MTAGLAIYDTVSCRKLVGGRGYKLMERDRCRFESRPSCPCACEFIESNFGHSTSIRRFTPTVWGKRVQWDHCCWPQVSAEEMKRTGVD